MKENIRKYRSSDKPSIIKLMEEFGDYLVAVDTMKRQRRAPEFGEYFTQKMIENDKKNDGIVYVAEQEGRIVGFIAGIMPKPSKEDLLECIPGKGGRIIELFVSEQYRNQKVGTVLMEKMEVYFRKAGCDVIKVEVFAPNIHAYQFYQRLGYQDRSFDLIKKL